MAKLGRRERAELRAMRARQYAMTLRRDLLAARCPEAGPVPSHLDGFGRPDTIKARPPKPGSNLYRGRQHRSK